MRSLVAVFLALLSVSALAEVSPEFAPIKLRPILNESVAITSIFGSVTNPVYVLGHPCVDSGVFFVAAVIPERNDALNQVLSSR